MHVGEAKREDVRNQGKTIEKNSPCFREAEKVFEIVKTIQHLGNSTVELSRVEYSTAESIRVQQSTVVK